MINIQQKNKDIEYGLIKEDELLDIIKDFLSCDKLMNTKEKYGKYCSFDFEDDEKKVRVELKSRRINHNLYNSVLIGHNKIISGEKNYKNNYEHYYFFNCLDGLYYIQYEPKLSDLEVVSINLKRGDISKMVNIPVDWLVKVEFLD